MKFTSYKNTTPATTTNAAKVVIEMVAKGYAAAANDPIYVKKAADIGKASITNVVKKRAFSPWGAAFVVAMTAAQLFLDPNTGQVTYGNTPVPGQTSNGACSYLASGYIHTLSACVAACSANFGGTCTVAATIEQTTQWRTQINRPTGTAAVYYYVLKSSIPPGQGYYVQDGEGYYVLPQTAPIATEDQVLDAVRHLLKPETFIDPNTGKLDRTITELAPLENGVKTELDKMIDPDPATNPSPEIAETIETSPEYQNRQLSDIAENTEPGEEPAPQEEVDYTWNDPTLQPYDTDIAVPQKDNMETKMQPVLNQLNQVTPEVNLTAEEGACMYEIPFEIGGVSGVSTQNYCQFEAQFQVIGGVIMAFAGIYAGMIMLGTRG